MRMLYVYTIECYSAVKENEIVKCAGKCMELEKTILSEVAQTHKDKQ